MEYVVGEKVYVLNGLRRHYVYSCTPEYYISARKVVKVGKYITLGINEKDKDKPGKTLRFIPSGKAFDGFSRSQGQISRSISVANEERNSVWWDESKNTYLVFTSREAAEKYLYEATGFMLYTYCDPIDYPVKKKEVL